MLNGKNNSVTGQRSKLVLGISNTICFKSIGYLVINRNAYLYLAFMQKTENLESRLMRNSKMKKSDWFTHWLFVLEISKFILFHIFISILPFQYGSKHRKRGNVSLCNTNESQGQFHFCQVDLGFSVHRAYLLLSHLTCTISGS